MQGHRSFLTALARSAFRVQQYALALHAPAISAELARAAHDAMARNQQSDAVRCARASDGARGAGLADRLGNFRIRAHFAVRQLLQIAPHDQLERRAAHIQRQIEPRLDATQMAIERRHPGFELLLVRRGHRLHGRRRKLAAQLRLQRAVAVPELQEADAAIRRTDHQQTERRAAARVGNRQSLAAAAIFARRHAELTVGLLVHATARPETRLIDRVGNRRVLAQLLLQRAQARRGLIFLGRAADDRLEIALQMERAVAGALGELRQPERLLRIRFDLARELVHDCVDRTGAAISADIVRTAAFAGAIAVLARLGRRREERHVLAQRAARGAGRAAVDPRGLHRVDELARAGRVAADYGVPELRFVRQWLGHGRAPR